MTAYEQHDELDCESVELETWHEAALRLRGEGFTSFDFLTAVDETSDPDDAQFTLILHLYDRSAQPIRQTFLTTRVADGVPVRSLTDVWAGAAWHERETFEMFGVFFDEFVDGSGEGLRPLLLPPGFSGTPLRKSFVLTARASKPWPGAKDPGESKPRSGRRRMTAPGVPDESWGPR